MQVTGRYRDVLRLRLDREREVPVDVRHFIYDCRSPIMVLAFRQKIVKSFEGAPSPLGSGPMV